MRKSRGSASFFAILRGTVLSLPVVLILYSVWSAWQNLRMSSCTGIAPSQRVLILHKELPRWDNNYIDNRIAQIATSIRGLGHTVTLLVDSAPLSKQREDEMLEPFREKGVNVLVIKSSETRLLAKEMVPSNLILVPWSQGEGMTVAESRVQLIVKEFRRKNVDAQIAILMDTVDYIASKKLGKNDVEVEHLKNMQISAMECADYILTSSEDSRQILLNLMPRSMVIPIAPFPFEFPERSFMNRWVSRDPSARNLVYIGSLSNEGNWRGMQWFLEEVWQPLVQKKIGPTGYLHLVGSIEQHVGTFIQSHYDRVILHGFKRDVTQVLQDAMLFIAPLKGVSGLPPATITALEYGVPLLTNTEGMWGLKLTDKDTVCLVRDTAEEWREAIEEIAQGRIDADRLSHAGTEHLQYYFTKRIFLQGINMMMLSVNDRSCSGRLAASS